MSWSFLTYSQINVALIFQFVTGWIRSSTSTKPSASPSNKKCTTFRWLAPVVSYHIAQAPLHQLHLHSSRTPLHSSPQSAPSQLLLCSHAAINCSCTTFCAAQAWLHEHTLRMRMEYAREIWPQLGTAQQKGERFIELALLSAKVMGRWGSIAAYRPRVLLCEDPHPPSVQSSLPLDWRVKIAQ